jgi:DNA gyrase subunit A
VLAIRDYEQAPYLVLATRNGLVKKTRLGDYNSPRQAGVIAINFREDDDELIGAELVNPEDDILLVSRKGQSIRFPADDSQLRPMGRATSGVTGMKFREGDQLLSMDVAQNGEDSFVFVVTEAGYAKRTPVGEYRVQGRAGFGIKVAKITDQRGDLVAGMIVHEDDEVLVVMQGGKVVRSAVAGVPAKGRDTMGVVFAKPDAGDRIIGVAHNAESSLDEDETEAAEASDVSDSAEGNPEAVDGVVGTADASTDATDDSADTSDD